MSYHVIIDFNNFCGRARAKDTGLYNARGEGTGITFYMLRMIKSLSEKFNPKSIIFVEDGGLSEERLKFYPDYKSERQKKRSEQTEDQLEAYNEYLLQRAKFKRYMDFCNVRHIRCKGEEADDVIAYMCHLSKFTKPFNLNGNLKHRLLVVSCDTDFIHLVSDEVHVWSPSKEKLYTPENTNPKKELLRKAILGDKTDGISSISGVGEKTIEKALDDYNEQFSWEEDYEIFFDRCKTSSVSKIRKIEEEKNIVLRNVEIISLLYNKGFVKYLSPEHKEEAKKVLSEFNETLDLTALMRMAFEDDFKTIYVNTKSSFNWASKLCA